MMMLLTLRMNITFPQIMDTKKGWGRVASLEFWIVPLRSILFVEVYYMQNISGTISNKNQKGYLLNNNPIVLANRTIPQPFFLFPFDNIY